MDVEYLGQFTINSTNFQMDLSLLISFVSEMVPLIIRQGSGRCWAFRHVATQVVSPLETTVSLPCLFWTHFLFVSPGAHSAIPVRRQSQMTPEEHRAARNYCVVFCQRPKLEDYTNVISNVLGPCQKANGNQLLQSKLQLLTLVYSIGNNGPLTEWFYSSSSLDPVGLMSNWTHKGMCQSFFPLSVNRLTNKDNYSLWSPDLSQSCLQLMKSFETVCDEMYCLP